MPGFLPARAAFDGRTIPASATKKSPCCVVGRTRVGGGGYLRYLCLGLFGDRLCLFHKGSCPAIDGFAVEVSVALVQGRTRRRSRGGGGGGTHVSACRSRWLLIYRFLSS